MLGIGFALIITKDGEIMKTLNLKIVVTLKLLTVLAVSSKVAFSQEAISLSRSPANFVQSEVVETAPIEQELWVDSTFKEDNDGILKSMKNDISSWEEKEEYVKQWNLRSTGLYSLTSDETKSQMVKSRSLKYLDKRITGEMKSADKDSTLGKAQVVSKTLRPSSTMAVSEEFKLKFQAKLLQGKATVRLINPYFDYDTQFALTGKVSMRVAKEFKPFSVKTEVNYQVTEGRYIASINKDLGYNFSTRASADASSKDSPTSENTDKKIELMYNLPF